MKTMIWPAALLAALSVTLVTGMETEEPVLAKPAHAEPVPTGSDSPRIVPHGEMQATRAAHQATPLPGGEVLITGGCADHGCDRELASAEIYDPATRSFRPAAPMSSPRRDHAAAVLPDGRVLVAGGWVDGALASAEVYDPATGRWTEAGRMREARGGAMAVPLPDGRMLVVGGSGGAGVARASAEIFDPATLTFSAAGAMHAPRRRPAAVALADGRVLVSGGGTGRGEVLRSAELFDPATGEFRQTGEMSLPRWTHASVLLEDGRVLIVGGSTPARIAGTRDDRQATTEIYDPATGEFTSGPTMHLPRRKVPGAVVVLPSGAVLVAGGAVQGELWRPGAEGFVPLQGEFGGLHEFATANLLPSGEVLVLGGYDARIQPSASAWMVLPAR